jgi:uncharacterized repeat protein (TIGR03803 family)
VPRRDLWIAASCILALATLLPVVSSGTQPVPPEQVLYSFIGGNDGAAPLSDLTFDGAGNLYGTTSQGGNAHNGTVFELKRSQSGWSEEVLYSFVGGIDGANPQAGVIFDQAGNLYGATMQGGRNNSGTLYKLTPNSRGGWTESTIYTFNCSGSAGCLPRADLAFDAKGNLYGTTSSGSSGSCVYKSNSGCGAVFELTPESGGTWTETTVHVFAGAPNDGSIPVAGVVLDSAGNLYGTTQYGGSGSCNRYSELPLGCGITYKLTLSGGTWTETMLHNIARGGGSGIYPSGELFLDDANHLFGVTQQGGDGLGTVFELNYSQEKGWQRTQPHIFYSNPDGAFPAGRLAADTKGDLFGVTSDGGNIFNWGSVFEVRRTDDGWKEWIFHAFNGPPDGRSPSAGLVSDPQGHLYGTTQFGGIGTACNQGCGTVYELTP